MKFLLAGIALLLTTGIRAQMTGFNASHAEVERQSEEKLISAIVPDTLRSIVAVISKEVHVAGTPAQLRTKNYVVDRWRHAGLSTKLYPYDVYIPLAQSSSLEMLSPQRKTFSLHEDTVEWEPKSEEYPWVNGYSASGTVTGNAVYVNYGLFSDYRDLDSLGISVKGKIVIARYGKSYRGIKAMLAEKAGAAALILYPDPSGDGYDAGDVYPAGPMRSSGSIQRGSIYNGHGDPTTPGYASATSAHHIWNDSMQTVPKIPVIPVSYGIASQILSAMHGHDIPNGNWQGGLAFRYHIDANAGMPVQLKLSVQCDTGLKPIWTTIATIEGSTWPDEWIIIGGHRDAWCHGAEDNAAGCASSVAAAEAFQKLAQEGIRPKRSVLFATWDAEEWGLLGSTEWVEQMEQELGAKAIVYINQDECATGSSFSAGADPTLRTFVYQVSKDVPDGTGNPIYTEWKKHSTDSIPSIGLLGGGSDFSPFYNHLGIPSLEHGFGGPFGQYHSNHDCIEWTNHFGDTNYRYHAASSQFAAVEAMRLANADILPFDFVELGSWLEKTIEHERVESWKKFHDSSDFLPVEQGIRNFIVQARAYAAARDLRALSDSAFLKNWNLVESMNRQIRSVEYAFTEPQGLYFDKWERNMLVLSDPENGYSDVSLPAIDLAIRHKNRTAANTSLAELSDAVQKATKLLRDITARLESL